MIRTVRVESVLNANVDDVWSAIQRPATARYVLRPLVWLPALDRRVEPVREGESVTGWLLLLCVLPLSKYTISVAEIDEDNWTLRSQEGGGLVRSWQHTLQAEPIDAGRCRYTDTVRIDAGRLTPVVAAFARVLFRYRHRRWSRLVRRGAVGPQASR